MDKMTITAKSYDEAVHEAVLKLGTTRDNILIEVVSEGSEGFFGLFAKPWVIKVSKKIRLEELEEPKAKTEAKKEITHKKTEKKAAKKNERSEKPDKAEKINRVQKEEAPLPEKEKEEKPAYTPQEIENLQKNADVFLKNVFRDIGMPVECSYDFNEQEKSLNILLSSEEDMGVLIGKRGQTLDSLQYIVSLVLNKDTQNYIRVKLDTENYRERRKEKLDSLARGIAAKVKKTRKAVTLEPMNPYERRIIHSALQSDQFVTTKSEGEEPFRYIIVLPKNSHFRKNRGRNSQKQQ